MSAGSLLLHGRVLIAYAFHISSWGYGSTAGDISLLIIAIIWADVIRMIVCHKFVRLHEEDDTISAMHDYALSKRGEH